ncbi:MAG: hypothetical protein K8F62_16590 [Pseudorhodoplanes sp.]|nr:hypothetical protein [Pseudorhodoplanes sp.]
MLDPLKNAWLKHREARANAEQNNDTRLPSRPRERIQKAADHLFSKHGAPAVTVETIAVRAESNKEYVLECFGSVEHLYADHLLRLVEIEKDLWQTLEDFHRRNPERQLRAWLGIVVPDEKRQFDPLLLSPAAMELGYQPNHPAHAVIKNNKTELRRRLRKFCYDALYRDPDGLAEKLIILAEGALVQSMIFGSDGLKDRLMEAAEDLLARHA